MMLVAGVLTLLLLWVGMRPRAMVPGRLQSAAEMAYETVLYMCVDTIGHEGKRFFPFVFTLFFFILFGNLLGVLPYCFTFTSHIAVTLALTLLVFVLVTLVGLRTTGCTSSAISCRRACPSALLPLLVPIEMHVVPVAHHLAVGAAVRQHDGRPRDAGGVRRLRGHAGRGRRDLSVPAGLSFAVNVDPDRLRNAGGVVAGLRVRHADLHLPARRGAPALTPANLSNRRSARRPPGATDATKGTRQMDLASAKEIGAGLAVIALCRRGRRHRPHLRRAGQQRRAQPGRARPRVRPGDSGLRADRGGRAVRAGHRVHHPVRLSA